MIQMKFGFTDVTAKEDSTPQTTDKQTFIDLVQLTRDNITTPSYATLEHNYFKLDGSMELFPDSPKPENFGWWSNSMSGSDGKFAAPIVLDISFTENHSSIGLTVQFEECGNNYASEFTVRWLRGSTLLEEKTVQPDGWVCPVPQTVENYDHMTLTFFGTNRPYRYLKIKALLYGIIRTFTEKEIIEAGCLEEIDPISAMLSINTLDFRLHSTDAEFSIVNPQGVYKFLQQRQPLTVTADDKPFGTFYLDEWMADSENIYTMSAIDAVGVLDATAFRGGIYAGKQSGALIAEIMNDAGMKFELSTSFASIPLTGYLPICSHREALQQVAFAIGAVVDCSRSGVVKIYGLTAEATSIGRGRKFQGGTIALKSYVTGVEVKEHNYVKSNEATELYNGELAAGEHEITFGEPCHSLTVTGATIKAQGENYAIVTVSAKGTVVLSGKRYTDTTRIVSCYMESIPAGQAQNIFKVENATLVSVSNSNAVAKRVFDYYQRRVDQEFSIALQNEQVGQSVAVETPYNEKKTGVIERLDTDLITLLTKAVIVGV